MIGIISIDEISFVSHGLFQNFRFALRNYLKTDFKEVKNADDLDNLTHLIIVDEHFGPHVEIWKQQHFIDKLNSKNIRTIVFNFEKIFNPLFPWNIDHQNKLTSIKNLEQFVSDVADASLLSKRYINKQMLSRDTVLEIDGNVNDKIDRILFLGQTSAHVYHNRRNVIQKAYNKGLPIDVIDSDRKLTYRQYLTKLASYKYIFNPLGTGLFLNIRYYEAIKLKCQPIQQYTDEMLKWYGELHQNKPFIFNDIDSFIMSKPVPLTQEYYLEDYFEQIDLKSYF